MYLCTRFHIVSPAVVQGQLQGACAPRHRAQRRQRIPVLLEGVQRWWPVFLPPGMYGFSSCGCRQTWEAVQAQLCCLWRCTLCIASTRRVDMQTPGYAVFEGFSEQVAIAYLV